MTIGIEANAEAAGDPAMEVDNHRANGRVRRRPADLHRKRSRVAANAGRTVLELVDVEIASRESLAATSI